jgi:hypothetical protein
MLIMNIRYRCEGVLGGKRGKIHDNVQICEIQEMISNWCKMHLRRRETHMSIMINNATRQSLPLRLPRATILESIPIHPLPNLV